MKIGFTGHRDKTCNSDLLMELYAEFPLAVWGHGNAKDGFDSQVDKFAIHWRIPCVRFNPQPEVIEKIGYVGALLKRNRELVCWLDDPDDLLVALYDGRQEGGTFRTVFFAGRSKITVREWKP